MSKERAVLIVDPRSHITNPIQEELLKLDIKSVVAPSVKHAQSVLSRSDEIVMVVCRDKMIGTLVGRDLPRIIISDEAVWDQTGEVEIIPHPFSCEFLAHRISMHIDSLI